MGLDRRKIDWTDWSWAGQVSDAVAQIIGWVPSERDLTEWWDPEDDESSGYFNWSSNGGRQFDPFSDLDAAIRAADLITTRRKLPFELAKRTDGTWRASFPTVRVEGVNQMPCRSICEAIIKLGQIPDPNQIFRGRKDQAKAITHRPPGQDTTPLLAVAVPSGAPPSLMSPQGLR